MGFLTGLVKIAADVVAVPVAAVVDVATLGETGATIAVVDKTVDDSVDAIDDLLNGDWL